MTDVLGALSLWESAPEPVNITVRGSAVLEERDESVGGLVASWWPLIDGGNAFQGSAFEFEVGVEVDLRGLDVRVPEPERDARGVDPGMQQAHCAGVPQRVRGDVLPGQRRTPAGRGSGMTGGMLKLWLTPGLL